MPIIKNNLGYELVSETQTKPVSAVKIQLDVLEGCAHHCDGCFVNRRNNAPTKEHLKSCREFVKSITDQGVLVDEILVGSTDFLSSSNIYDILANKDFLDMVNSNAPILAFVSTLKGSGLRQFCQFLNNRINHDTEIEIGIATTPKEIMSVDYIDTVKDRLKILDTHLELNSTFTFIINIDNYDINYEALHKFVVHNFDTTYDLIPSVARSQKSELILDRLNNINNYFNGLDAGNLANNIMVDHSHSGMKFKVLNFRKGDWYISPFLYENMSIYNDVFKIDTFDDHYKKSLEQYSYNMECHTCDFLSSCASRGIPLLMKSLGVDKCIAPKANMEKNKHTYMEVANKMYDWHGYSTEVDKEGYRTKFYEAENLDKIKEMYYGYNKDTA